MTHRALAHFALALVALLALHAPTASRSRAATPEPAQTHVLRHENVLGTSLELRVRSRDASLPAKAEAVALAEIDRLARVFSTYSPQSELSRWQATPPDFNAPVSPELFAVMDLSDHWRRSTAAAFHPGAALIGKLWRDVAADGREPADSLLADAVHRLATPPWTLDRTARTARRTGNYPVTLDAIAKGWILEQASSMAWQLGGMESLMLEIGGDLRLRGNATERIALVDPRHDAENASPIAWADLHDAALATSGGYRRHVAPKAPRPRSHILDPRSGRPASAVLSATVVAPDAATADAMATAFNVMEPEASLRLANATPGVSCLLVLPDGRPIPSARWTGGLQTTSDPMELPKANPGKTNAAPSFELSLSFELRSPGGGRYQRPYVAAWVEDADAFPVRTLLLWVLQSQKGQRWIPDLRRWHRSDDTRRLADDKDMVATVSGATRNPGKYSVTWDGKDDHGKPVKPGKYTLYLEAAREHGTYQIIKHDFVVGADPFAVDLKGNEEIAAARVECRRVQRP